MVQCIHVHVRQSVVVWLLFCCCQFVSFCFVVIILLLLVCFVVVSFFCCCCQFVFILLVYHDIVQLIMRPGTNWCLLLLQAWGAQAHGWQDHEDEGDAKRRPHQGGYDRFVEYSHFILSQVLLFSSLFIPLTCCSHLLPFFLPWASLPSFLSHSRLYSRLVSHYRADRHVLLHRAHHRPSGTAQERPRHLHDQRWSPLRCVPHPR